MSALVDLEALGQLLGSHGLEHVFHPIVKACEASRASRHGDLQRWQSLVDCMPEIMVSHVDLATQVRLESDTVTRSQQSDLKHKLLELSPWRKGPFQLFGIHIDSEWRSDSKWERIAPHVDLRARTVLDVGCGNGYYMLRMLGAGADFVLGVDPAALYAMQFRAINKYTGRQDAQLLPLTLEELPQTLQFDTVFSMGVLYHRRSPQAHLADLKNRLRYGGELVLETLVTGTQDDSLLAPGPRYAGMRNVWAIPTVARLESWCGQAGFCDIELLDCSPTTTDEQRQTKWMTTWSLKQFLDPSDPGLTVEGYPAPLRAIIKCRKP